MGERKSLPQPWLPLSDFLFSACLAPPPRVNPWPPTGECREAREEGESRVPSYVAAVCVLCSEGRLADAVPPPPHWLVAHHPLHPSSNTSSHAARRGMDPLGTTGTAAGCMRGATSASSAAEDPEPDAADRMHELRLPTSPPRPHPLKGPCLVLVIE